MKKLFVSLLSIALFSFSQAFVSYELVEKDGKKILILGINHGKEIEHYTGNAAEEFINFVKVLQQDEKIETSIPCFYELSDEAYKAINEKQVQSDILIKKLVHFISKNKNKSQNGIHFTNFEPREDEISSQAYYSISRFDSIFEQLGAGKQVIAVESNKPVHAKNLNTILTTHSGWKRARQFIRNNNVSKLTVPIYLAGLAKWATNLKQWQSKNNH